MNRFLAKQVHHLEGRPSEVSNTRSHSRDPVSCLNLKQKGAQKLAQMFLGRVLILSRFSQFLIANLNYECKMVSIFSEKKKTLANPCMNIASCY